MAYNGSTWDESTPTNATLANEIDDVARDIKIGVRGRMAQEHVWAAAQSATAEGGLHKYITLQLQSSPPSLVVGTSTQVGALYVTSGNALIFQNSASQAVTVVASGARSALPSGAMLPYGGNAAPGGFYLCDGQAYSRTTDSALYAAIGTIWGTGDGSTTFNVPALGGYTLVCKSAGGMFASMAATTGELAHVLTGTESGVAAHTHTMDLWNSSGVEHAYPSGSYNNAYARQGVTNASTASDASTGHNNVQPSIVCNYIIAR